MTGGQEDMRTRRQRKGGQDGRTGKQEGRRKGGKEDRRTGGKEDRTLFRCLSHFRSEPKLKCYAWLLGPFEFNSPFLKLPLQHFCDALPMRPWLKL